MPNTHEEMVNARIRANTKRKLKLLGKMIKKQQQIENLQNQVESLRVCYAVLEQKNEELKALHQVILNTHSQN